MSITRDIAATYRGPRTVMRRLLEMGRREDRALLFVLFAGGLAFVAQAPWQSRVAYYRPEIPLEARLYWSALLFIFILPMALYAVAFVSGLVSRLIGRPVSGYKARLALFWAFLAASPLMLLCGLTAAFIGPGPGSQAVSLIWCVVFAWFWVSNLTEAGRSNE